MEEAGALIDTVEVISEYCSACRDVKLEVYDWRNSKVCE